MYDCILPIGIHLKEDIQWVKLGETIDWEIVDEEYSRNSENEATGQKEYDFCVAFSPLYI